MMFADDAKIWTKISSESNSNSLQKDLNKLIIWSQTWLLKFHREKCKVTHIGHQLNTTYSMTDSGKSVQLNATREEKDLRVYSLKPSLQCIKASSKAMSVMRLKGTSKALVQKNLTYCIKHTYDFTLNTA